MRQITYEDLRKKIESAYKNNASNRRFATGIFNGSTDGLYGYGVDIGSSVVDNIGMNDTNNDKRYIDDIYDHSENIEGVKSRLMRLREMM